MFSVHRDTLVISGMDADKPALPNARRTLAVINATKSNQSINIAFIEPKLLGTNPGDPNFLELNDKGQVPVFIEANGTVHVGSNHIMRLIALKVKGQSLFPSDNKALCAEIEEQQEFGDLLNNDILKTIIYERYIKPEFFDVEGDEAAVAEAVVRFHAVAGNLNQRLEKTGYMVGDHLTLADFSLANAETYWPVLIKMDDLTLGNYPHYVSFMETMSKNHYWVETSYNQALQASGLGITQPQTPTASPA